MIAGRYHGSRVAKCRGSFKACAWYITSPAVSICRFHGTRRRWILLFEPGALLCRRGKVAHHTSRGKITMIWQPEGAQLLGQNVWKALASGMGHLAQGDKSTYQRRRGLSGKRLKWYSPGLGQLYKEVYTSYPRRRGYGVMLKNNT